MVFLNLIINSRNKDHHKLNNYESDNISLLEEIRDLTEKQDFLERDISVVKKENENKTAENLQIIRKLQTMEKNYQSKVDLLAQKNEKMSKGMNKNTNIGTVKLIQGIGPKIDWTTKKNKQLVWAILALKP